MTVNVPGCIITPRNITQDVSKGGVLSPRLFNIALASPTGIFSSAHRNDISFYVLCRNLAIWCVGPTTHDFPVRTVLQRGID